MRQLLSTTRHPRQHRAVRGVSAALGSLALVVALGACSGDDEPEGDPSAAPSEEEQIGAPQRGCRAEVEVTGAAEASWDGRATVTLADPEVSGEAQPEAVYMAMDGKQSVTIYAGGEEFPTAVTYSDGENVTFASAPEVTDGIEAETDGTRAQVDAEIYDVDENAAQVVATIRCLGGNGDDEDADGGNGGGDGGGDGGGGREGRGDREGQGDDS